MQIMGSQLQLPVWAPKVEASVWPEIAFSVFAKMSATIHLGLGELDYSWRLPGRAVPHNSLAGPECYLRHRHPGQINRQCSRKATQGLLRLFANGNRKVDVLQRRSCHRVRMHCNEDHPAKSLGYRGSGGYPR